MYTCTSYYNSLRQVINLTLSCTHVLLITKGDDPVKRIITYDIYFGRLDQPEPAVVMQSLIRNQVKKVYHCCMYGFLTRSVKGMPWDIFSLFSFEWKSSASRKATSSWKTIHVPVHVSAFKNFKVVYMGRLTMKRIPKSVYNHMVFKISNSVTLPSKMNL